MRDGVPAAWQAEIEYEVLKSSSGGSSGASSNSPDEREALRERKTATLIAFLDDVLKGEQAVS